MKIIEIEQNTKRWRQFRKYHIGASDASTIMNLNPFRTPLNLWEEKTFDWQEEMTEKMKEGQRLEPIARKEFEIQMGLSFNPLVAESTEHSFISASFDGITQDFTKAVEIKCGKGSHKLAMRGEIPPYYFAQPQHQMYVSGLEEIYYFSFDGKKGITFTLVRDNQYIKKMIEKEIDFWESLQSFKPPKS